MLTCCVRPLGNVLLLLMLFFLGQSAVEAGMYVTIYDEEQVAVFGVKNAAGEELIFDDIPDSLSIMHQATWTILDHSGGNASTTSSVDDVFYNNGPPLRCGIRSGWFQVICFLEPTAAAANRQRTTFPKTGPT